MPGNNNIIGVLFKLAQAGVIVDADWETDHRNKRLYRFVHKGQAKFLTAAQAKPYLDALATEYGLDK